MRIFFRIQRRQADLAVRCADAGLDLGLALDLAVEADRFGDDVADAPARIERGIGILEDHLHARLDVAMLLALGQRADFIALALDRPRAGLVQPADQTGDSRLAAAGFAEIGRAHA